MDNPWTDLPSRAPYILPSDREPIERFNAMAGEGVRIRPELLPEPFLGAPTASVVLLSLNPGFSNDDALAHAREEFVQACRRNLAHHASDYPFLYLDPRFSDTPGGYWWTIRLRPLLDEGIELESLSQNIMCVEWFPYHSKFFEPLPELIPSQQYGFNLVSRAVARDALIIMMRSEDRWLCSIPFLVGHRRKRSLINPQNVVISRRNYDGDFPALVDMLRSLPFKKVSRAATNVTGTCDSLLQFAAGVIGATYIPGRRMVVRSSGHLRLEVAADASGMIAVHLASEDRELARWLAMINAGDGPLPSVARADSYEAPAAPLWRYGFIWPGPPAPTLKRQGRLRRIREPGSADFDQFGVDEA